MNEGRTVFAQLMDWLPKYQFEKCVRRYNGNRRVRTLTCYEQFLVMVFAQLTYRESLRDIDTCMRTLGHRLYHAGIRGPMARSTLADANEKRPWTIFADFAQVLIREATDLYAGESFAAELKQAVYALDSTTIDLCLSVFPCARFRRTKAAIKLHTLLDLRGPIPTFVYISDGKLHDVNAWTKYPSNWVRFFDAETDRFFVYLTNNFALSVLTIALLYKSRWQVELFFKWIKQHLRIKSFFGTLANAVKTQVWIAICLYVLVAILKKQLNLPGSLHKILQILSVNAFEKVALQELLTQTMPQFQDGDNHNQLMLFDL
ncbi:MAG: DUF4372 domain-containing protein [Verrucomicrobia bacterium]|nr:DUF4372 domain-containing protein [Verrucomicrobiota bacterium]MBU1735088.1 DUF4372 domain-containing protein [Verrucomicrobiota bacterium]MBU1856396.1 DUF4372 domain-containing protein [Verrucomicrobiota bacterium]